MNYILRFFTFAATLAVVACHNDERTSKRSSDNTKTASKHTRQSAPSDLNAIFRLTEGHDYTSQDAYHQLEKRIALLGHTDLLNVLEQIGDDRHLPRNRVIFTVAISELARRDPEAAMSLYSPKRMEPGEPGFMQVAIILAKTGAPALENWLRNNLSSGTSDVQNDCLTISLSALSAVDAKSAFAFLSTIDFSTVSKSDIINAIFTRFGKQSPLAADVAASEYYTGSDLDLARYNISNGAGKDDPALGIDIARKIVDDDLRGKAIAGRLSTWLDSSRAEAIALLGNLSPKELQVVLQGDVFEPDSLVNKLGKIDPESLCTLLNKLAVSSANEGVFLTAIARLSLENPEKATSLLESLPDGDTKRRMIGSQFDALARENSTHAIKSASMLIEEGSKREAYSSIGDVVGYQGLNSIKEIAADVPDKYRNTFMVAALPHIINQNPREAAELIENKEIVMDAGEKQEMFARLGEQLVGPDSAFALEWLEKLSPDDQPFAMKGIASKMAKTDVEGLAAMLSSMPMDMKWETGVTVLIDNIRDSDPEMAKKWQDALSSNK